MVVWLHSPPAIFPRDPAGPGLPPPAAHPAEQHSAGTAFVTVDGCSPPLELELVPEPGQPGCGRLCRQGLHHAVEDGLGRAVAARYTCSLGEECFRIVFTQSTSDAAYLSTTLFRAGGSYVLTGAGGTRGIGAR